MSVQRGCLEIEREPGAWYCVVAWREYDFDFEHGYSMYGPCDTADAASGEMHAMEANPGGSTAVTWEKLTDWHKKLVDDKLNSWAGSSSGSWPGRTPWHRH